MKDCEVDPPILIDKAKGIMLYGAKGDFYYDTISSWWCNVHGHNHPRIKKAIKKQLDLLEHVLFAGFTHKAAILLSEALISIAPHGLSRAFFSDNGSTAVEAAMKISFQYWKNTGRKGKVKFVSLDHGYHGDTIGAMSVSSIGIFNKVFSELFFDSFRVSSPYCYRCPAGKKRGYCQIECIEPLKALLKKHSDEIAGLIIEPIVMAAGGMIIYPAEYLRQADELAKNYNIHLIVDEVATAFGRTGRMFASEYADIRPDFMCLSKGITAGYLPLGATLVTEKIYRAFYDDYARKKTFYHGHTYTANPISCAAALESLKIFEEEGTLEKVVCLSKDFHNSIERLRPLSIVGDIRRIGMIAAIELVKNKNSKQPFGFKERIGYKIYKEGLKKHLILRPLGNIIYFFLPLCVKKQEFEYIIDATHSILRKY